MGRRPKHLIKIPEIIDDCFLYFIQTPDHLPFPIKRVYYIMKPNTRLPRGYHAHKKADQVIFCLQGSIKITLDDGKKRQEIILDNPGMGIFQKRMVWVEMSNFKKNTILLVLSSQKFETEDYIRDYHHFLKLANGKKTKRII
jgi:UDP-2-acetamido-3-amino-2,3-dideoxy-glucuronate N-acetyltransferase